MAHLTLTDTAPTLMDMALADLTIDDTIQQRVGLHAGMALDYAELYLQGADLGRIVVFDDGAQRWVADGFHRCKAAWHAHLSTLPVEVYQGSRRDALLYAAGANKHGLQRSNEDKRRAVMTLLYDAEWAQWSDGAIARHVGVTQQYVSKLRRSLTTVVSENGDNIPEQPTVRKYHNKYGQEVTMQVDGIGHRNGHATCADCGRPLTDPASIQRGVGPICACKTPAASGSPSAGSLSTDMSAPPLLGAAPIEEPSLPEEQAPMPPARGTPEWCVMKQRCAELLAELYRLAAKYGIESVRREVIAPFYARYGRPLPGTEAVPTADPAPDEAPTQAPAPVEPPAAADPDSLDAIAEQRETIVQASQRRRSAAYGQLPPKVMAALQAHGPDGATAATIAKALDAPRVQVWHCLERLVAHGTAVKEAKSYVAKDAAV